MSLCDATHINYIERMPYRLDLPLPARIIPAVTLVFFALGEIAGIVGAIMTKEPEGWIPVVLCGVALCVWWWVYLSLPYRIEFNGPEDIRFIALRRTVRTSAMQIQSLKKGGTGMYVLRHSAGKLNVNIQFTGFYEFLHDIKAVNPAFETGGI